MKKLLMFFMASLVVLAGYNLFPNKSSAAVNYSGGVLSGYGFHLSPGESNDGSRKYQITDNNEATGLTMVPWDRPGNGIDHLVRVTMPTKMNGNAIRIKANGPVLIKFLRVGTILKPTGANWMTVSAENADGRLITIPTVSQFDGVILFNGSGYQSDVTVYEFNVYNLTTVPDAPLNLTAVGGNALVDLSWSAAVKAGSYTIKRSTNAGGPYNTIQSNVTDTHYKDTTVINGTQYYYVITAVNQIGESVNSNETTATPVGEVPPIPSAPNNLTAVGSSELQAITLNGESVTGAVYYNVMRSLTANGPYTSIALNLNEPTYNDFDIDFDTQYYYVVTAVNEGGQSQYSNEASAIIDAIPQGRALLTIYLSGGQIKEYDLSMGELEEFINWYDTKDSGTGPSKYKFTKTWNYGPFKARSEYVIFDKILTFDVDEYEVPIEE